MKNVAACSCQSRGCDLQEFFRHGNQSFPAILNEVAIIETHATIIDTEPDADAIIIDGSAMINTLTPPNTKTFEEYAATDVLPTLQLCSVKYQITDIVFDVYHASSLKAETRSRRRVTGNGKLTANWRCFLRHNDNKNELFNFLAYKIAEMHTSNVVIVSNRIISLNSCTPKPHQKRVAELS